MFIFGVFDDYYVMLEQKIFGNFLRIRDYHDYSFSFAKFPEIKPRSNFPGNGGNIASVEIFIPIRNIPGNSGNEIPILFPFPPPYLPATHIFPNDSPRILTGYSNPEKKMGASISMLANR